MKRILIYLSLIILTSCSSNKTTSKKSTPLIFMSTVKAPISCKFIGIVYGPHQTFTSGNYKLGKNITQAHIDQAKRIGANYIEMNQLETQGKGYACPESDLLNLKIKPF